jgi:hypothetical protein
VANIEAILGYGMSAGNKVVARVRDQTSGFVRKGQLGASMGTTNEALYGCGLTLDYVGPGTL